MNGNTISVCICTYNRSESLRRTLGTLAEQKNVDWNHVEVIVVDNNCSDQTPQTVQEFASILPIRRVVEPRQGLAHARNKAITESTGEWMLFTDDDVLLEPDWLSSYVSNTSRYERAEFAGGRVLPLWIGPKPRWWKEEHLDLLDGVLVWYEPPGQTRYFYTDDPEPFGASLAIRKSLVDKVGMFRTDLGNIGSKVGRGEDTEIVRRARMAKLQGVYIAEAVCWHRVEPRRLTLSALYDQGLAIAHAHRTIGDPSAVGSRMTALQFLVRGLLQLGKGRGDRFRQCVINAGIQVGLLET